MKIRGTSKRQAVLMSSARGIKLSPTLKKVYGLDRGKAVLVGVKGGTATGAKVVPFSSKGQGPRFGREPIGRISSYNGSYGSSRGGGFLRSAGSWLKSKLGR